MNNYWCENCDHRWEDENPKKCPLCLSSEIRRTMSREEAERLGLINK